MRIDITQDIYLNNAWCVVFEIHQFVDGKERVQAVVLIDYDAEELILEHTTANPDLLILLHAGDYLVYHPDLKADEYPIPHGKSVKQTQVVFGFIVYNKADTDILFAKYSMDYYLQETFLQDPIFIALCLCFLDWLVAVVSFIAVEVNMKKAHIRFKQDEHIIRQSIGVFTGFSKQRISIPMVIPSELLITP